MINNVMDTVNIINKLNGILSGFDIPPHIIRCIAIGLVSGKNNCKDTKNISQYGLCNNVNLYKTIFNRLSEKYPDYGWMRCIGVGLDMEMLLWNYGFCNDIEVFMYKPNVHSVSDFVLKCLDERDTYDSSRHPVVYAICEIWFDYIWNNNEK